MFTVIQDHGREGVWSSLMALQTAGLAFLLLNNHNSDFEVFLERYSPREKNLNCSEIFTDCFI